MDFKLKQIAEQCDFNISDLKYITRMGALSKIIGSKISEDQKNDRREWTRLNPTEAITTCFAGTFYRDLRVIKPAFRATMQALKGFKILFGQSPGIRRLPWLVLFENYLKQEASQIIFEFVDVQNSKNHEIPIPLPLRLQIGHRTVLCHNRAIINNSGLWFYAVSDLLFKFLKNLDLNLSDLDPVRLFGISDRTEFDRFVNEDMDNILKYLEKNQNHQQESQQ